MAGLPLASVEAPFVSTSSVALRYSAANFGVYSAAVRLKFSAGC